MKMRRPIAVFRVASDGGEDLTAADGLWALEPGKGVFREVAVERPESLAFVGLVLEDYRGTVIERRVVHLETVHAARERRSEARARFDEQVDADVDRARLEPFSGARPARPAGPECLARVESARLVVASDPDTRACVSHRGENVRGEALDVIEHVETAELRARHVQVELVKPPIQQRIWEDGRGVLGVRAEPIHDRVGVRERRKAARVTKAVVSKPRAYRL